MSMTGRWIDDLRERAERGDAEARETLRHAGLWSDEGEEEEAAAAYAASHSLAVEPSIMQSVNALASLPAGARARALAILETDETGDGFGDEEDGDGEGFFDQDEEGNNRCTSHADTIM
jgi:hypothetical protein